MGAVGAGIVLLLVGLAALAGGGAMAIFAGKALAAGEEGEVVVRNNETGQSASVGKSKLVPLIGVILGAVFAIGGIVLIVRAIMAFAA